MGRDDIVSAQAFISALLKDATLELCQTPFGSHSGIIPCVCTSLIREFSESGPPSRPLKYTGAMQGLVVGVFMWIT